MKSATLLLAFLALLALACAAEENISAEAKISKGDVELAIKTKKTNDDKKNSPTRLLFTLSRKDSKDSVVFRLDQVAEVAEVSSGAWRRIKDANNEDKYTVDMDQFKYSIEKEDDTIKVVGKYDKPNKDNSGDSGDSGDSGNSDSGKLKRMEITASFGELKGKKNPINLGIKFVDFVKDKEEFQVDDPASLLLDFLVEKPVDDITIDSPFEEVTIGEAFISIAKSVTDKDEKEYEIYKLKDEDEVFVIFTEEILKETATVEYRDLFIGLN
eukprot:CAMPEP_0177650702 /NCGR_PEP_ID=MMETSP0447-20121125/12094_1 /TAXON_ID=0 /ORGANISM="Stygamoeba regulata, Strain BSH-02190019" /LENGTH=269 /DNA_ID=CAMNT_0019153611 /DNA_START=92 /DNA_END=901 /DNA_ORIENTATION=-